ncbi:LysR family transcriptional regulator [Photobacterium aphoticum]|uniref:Transcriptional regulator n=1 Tax=Photobacterium aphoticum TaxID=754436 RepID=A0A0J1JAF9_9GAMM|nr:LysR family transcriptional regulator [Photobacterium aphoticum]KLU98481.1 transcriptional regulator [Photobacterium aphoticum]PSU57426.1 LysR family transcriptional regulator [Photobacterium aphoticum]GHA63434.1 LysR family transcriptional regulator [Photobacterium aphoticum]
MLDKMDFFVCVIRCGSISAAARKFNISCSAGSRWLQELESHFGMTLMRRSNRVLTLTPAGQKLFDDFSPLADSADQLRRSIQDFKSEDIGHINIACTPVYANHFLMERVADYMDAHPNVTFNIVVSPWALDLAAESDLMISANAHYQGYREKDLHLVRRELYQCPFIAVATRAYLDKHGEPLVPSELTQHRCLFASTLTGSNDWIFSLGDETEMIKIPKTLEVNDSDLLLDGVMHDAGVGYLPEFLVKDRVERGEIVQILPDYTTSMWSVNLYYHPPQKASTVATHFKNTLLADPFSA